MDFELNEEQRAFQDAARVFAEDVFAPNAAAWDENSIFPVEELRQAAALGFAGILLRRGTRRLGPKAPGRDRHLRGACRRVHFDLGLYLDPPTWRAG